MLFYHMVCMYNPWVLSVAGRQPAIHCSQTLIRNIYLRVANYMAILLILRFSRLMVPMFISWAIRRWPMSRG